MFKATKFGGILTQQKAQPSPFTRVTGFLEKDYTELICHSIIWTYPEINDLNKHTYS